MLRGHPATTVKTRLGDASSASQRAFMSCAPSDLERTFGGGHDCQLCSLEMWGEDRVTADHLRAFGDGNRSTRALSKKKTGKEQHRSDGKEERECRGAAEHVLRQCG